MALPLLLFFSLFFAAAFFWPTWRLWRREGVNALVLPYDNTAHGLVGKWFRGALSGIFALLVALALGLSEAVLGPLLWLDGSGVDAAGWVLLAVALGWVVIAQAQMGNTGGSASMPRPRRRWCVPASSGSAAIRSSSACAPASSACSCCYPTP